jgi:hypothetical protein
MPINSNKETEIDTETIVQNSIVEIPLFSVESNHVEEVNKKYGETYRPGLNFFFYNEAMKWPLIW